MNRRFILVVCFGFLSCGWVWGQDKPAKWDLSTCIDYALSQNIQVKKTKVALDESRENTMQAKAELFPSLSFSSGQNLVNHPKGVNTDKNSYSGSYGFNSSVTLYNGGKLRKTFQQQELQEHIQELYIKEAENDIELAITESYLQILYADEAVKICQNTLEVSAAQCDRARELLAAGSVSRTDLAQLESQYSSDKYQLVAAQATLDQNKLDLKQLLELGITEEMDLVIPELTEEAVLKMIPGKVAVYEASLTIMPEIASSRLGIESAGLEKMKAQAGYLPSLNLTAGIGTSHVSGSDYTFGRQLRNSFNESVGLTLSVPIYSRRQNKSAVNIARLKVEDAELSYQGAEKTLLKTVESVYLDAVSSQDRYKAASESLNAAELSFQLTREQFDLGMKNTVEFLTEKNKLLSAEQEVIQAKYLAILSQQLLNFYQGKPIAL